MLLFYYLFLLKFLHMDYWETQERQTMGVKNRTRYLSCEVTFLSSILFTNRSRQSLITLLIYTLFDGRVLSENACEAMQQKLQQSRIINGCYYHYPRFIPHVLQITKSSLKHLVYTWRSLLQVRLADFSYLADFSCSIYFRWFFRYMIFTICILL